VKGEGIKTFPLAAGQNHCKDAHKPLLTSRYSFCDQKNSETDKHKRDFTIIAGRPDAVKSL
jgi:hypothetical protein